MPMQRKMVLPAMLACDHHKTTIGALLVLAIRALFCQYC